MVQVEVVGGGHDEDGSVSPYFSMWACACVHEVNHESIYIVVADSSHLVRMFPGLPGPN